MKSKKSKHIKPIINKEVRALLDEWNNYQTINNEQISKDYYSMLKQDVGLISFFEEIWMFGRIMSNMIWSNKYESYYKTVDYCLALLLETKSKLNIYLAKMFNTLNGRNIAIKLKRFDLEIKEYEELIQKKQTEANSNSLINTRKIEILNQKIDQTFNLKNQFISKSKQVSKNEFNEFKLFVNQILNDSKSSYISSLNKITKDSIEDEIDKLKHFVKKYWKNIVNYVDNCIHVVNRFRNVKVIK